MERTGRCRSSRTTAPKQFGAGARHARLPQYGVAALGRGKSVYRVFQCLTSAELGNLRGLDANLLAGARVAARARLAFAHAEGPKADECYGLALLQRPRDRVDRPIERLFRSGFGNACGPRNNFNQLRLVNCYPLLLIGEKRIPCAAEPSGIKGSCGKIFSVAMSANSGELRRLLYSKREKPVSSKNKKIVSCNRRTSVVQNITCSDAPARTDRRSEARSGD